MVNETSGLNPVDFASRKACLAELVAEANQPGRQSEPFTRLLRWLLADAEKRAISPLSDMPRDEYVKRPIALGYRDEARHAYPWHPLLK
jgi:hypothetical protein